jgi:AraC family transcriptional regulator of adaptative response/methylated-DNA-[protein]-cysteine methyltransferase
MATMVAHHDTIAVPPSDGEAWRAVEQRDARYDGQFVYAVASTMVYCRPSCPSRRPSRANVSFFADCDDAERSGYRACLRCQPRRDEADSPNAKAIQAARAYLDHHAGRAVPLAELASRTGLSVSHLQRSFKRVVGMSPKAYQDVKRLSLFKSRLRAGDTVSRATYEAGFGSSSRVYERSDAMLGMTPAAFRRGGAGVHITYAIVDAPLGRVLVAMTDRGVCAVELGSTDAEVERVLSADFPRATLERKDDPRHPWVRAVLDRVRRPRNASSTDVPLDVGGTAFQMKVWKALQEIPAGDRRSYQQVAQAIGQPTASRAVARACATNRIAVVIPCHRVVRGSGEPAGYKWGVDRKRRLLDQEAG